MKMTETVTVDPIHPGEILKEEFIKPFGITANKLAIELKVPASRIDQIVKGKRAITAETALRLAAFFGTSNLFWMNLQSRYELECIQREKGDRISREVIPIAV